MNIMCLWIIYERSKGGPEVRFECENEKGCYVGGSSVKHLDILTDSLRW